MSNAAQIFTPSRFCRILARARSANIPGSWEGSAYRSHPCGLIAGNIRLDNHWHVDDVSTIYIATTDKWRAGCQDSFANGDPFPKPVDGELIQVWYSGRWKSEAYREALEGKVVAILNRALAQIAAVESWSAAIEAHAAYCKANERAKVESAALALAAGG